MKNLVLAPGHIKGFLIIMQEDLAMKLAIAPKELIDAPVDEPAFWLFDADSWKRQPEHLEVRKVESYNTTRYEFRYGKIHSRDDYNRAHMMISGHSSFAGSRRLYETDSLNDIVDNLTAAVTTLNNYDERVVQETAKAPWHQRMWDFLTSDPDSDRLALPWNVILVTIPRDITVELDCERATMPGMFSQPGLSSG